MIRLLAALALLHSSAAIADPLVSIGKASSQVLLDTATADACSPTVINKYTKFSVTRLDGVDASYVLVRQDLEVGTGCFEGHSPANVKVMSFALDVSSGKVGTKPLWAVATEGTDVTVDGAWVEVVMPGCCGAPTQRQIYSLRSGELMASSTADTLRISVANTPLWRRLAIDERTSIPNAIAALYLFDNRQIRQLLVLENTRPAARQPWRVGRFEFRNSKGTSARFFKQPNFTGEAVRIELVCECQAPPVTVEIPFLDDALDTRQATVAPNGAVRVMASAHGAALQSGVRDKRPSGSKP